MSIIRIVRMPALDAALARFDGWWSGLSHRERVLLGVMAVLLFVVVAVFGVVKPLQAARAEALQDIRTYETLTARIRAAGTLAPATAPMRTGAPIEIIAGSAQSFGLAVQASPTADGAVQAVIADGSYDAILGWVADLGATSALRLRTADLRRGTAPGRVGATLVFQ